MTRPTTPVSDLAGFEWMAEPRSGWRTIGLADSHKRCRRRCGRLAVAELNRPTWNPRTGQNRASWWAYCADHMYGRWVEDGRVMGWALREVAAS